MSPFLKCRNAVAKAGSFSLRLLGLPDILAPKIPPERMELATRINRIEAKPSPFLEAISQRPYTPEELGCDPYPAAQLRSMGQQSSAPREDAAQLALRLKGVAESLRDHPPRGMVKNGCFYVACKREGQGTGWSYHAVGFGVSDLDCFITPKLEPAKSGRLDPSALQRLVANMAERERKRDAAVRTLDRLGYTHRGGVEWAPPIGNRVIGTPESVAAVLASGDEMRDAIAFALDQHNPDGLEWLRAWDEGDPTAARELEEWRTREREAARQRQAAR
jgi:hypothetical protein